MEVSERFSKHADWCRAMAEEYRRDAQSVKEPQRTKWLKAAERLEDDETFYREHAGYYQ
jgi:hypothetical protein